MVTFKSQEIWQKFKFLVSKNVKGGLSNTGSLHDSSQAPIRKEKLEKPKYAHAVLIIPVLKSSGHSILSGPITQEPNGAGKHAIPGKLADLGALLKMAHDLDLK